MERDSAEMDGRGTHETGENDAEEGTFVCVDVWTTHTGQWTGSATGTATLAVLASVATLALPVLLAEVVLLLPLIGSPPSAACHCCPPARALACTTTWTT